MRFPRCNLWLVGAALALMGAGATARRSLQDPYLAGLAPVAATGADLGALETAVFAATGIERKATLAGLVGAVDAWLEAGGRAACGHEEEHELSSTACTRAGGGELDHLYEKILEAWYATGELSAAQLVILYGALPAFLEGRYAIEGTRILPIVLDLSPEAIADERARIVASGLAAASHWSAATIAAELERKQRSGSDLASLRARMNPSGVDVRALMMEGLVRPLALTLGTTGVRMTQAPPAPAETLPAVAVQVAAVAVPADPAPAPAAPDGSAASPSAAPPEPGPELRSGPAPGLPVRDVRINQAGFAVGYAGTGRGYGIEDGT